MNWVNVEVGQTDIKLLSQVIIPVYPWLSKGRKSPENLVYFFGKWLYV